MKNEIVKFTPPTMDEIKAQIQGGQQQEYLDRVSLQHGVSAAVTEGTAKAGDILLGKETNLGDDVVMLVIGWRPHAIEFDEDGVAAESFDRKDPEYVRIAAAGFKQGYYYGPDYLCYFPDFEKFGSWHFSRTNRKQGVALAKWIEGPIRVWSENKKGKKATYKVLVAEPAEDYVIDLEAIDPEKKEWAVSKFYEPLRQLTTDETPAGPSR
jgi:hypothetical protein